MTHFDIVEARLRFSEMDDDSLLRVVNQSSTFLPEAIQLAREELSRRGVDFQNKLATPDGAPSPPYNLKMRTDNRTTFNIKTFGCMVVVPWLVFGFLQLVSLVFGFGNPAISTEIKTLFAIAMLIWLFLPFTLYIERYSNYIGGFSLALLVSWIVVFSLGYSSI